LVLVVRAIQTPAIVVAILRFKHLIPQMVVVEVAVMQILHMVLVKTVAQVAVAV
jgi:hypothetical protein